MTFDPSLVDTLRTLEVEAVEGGRPQNAFSTSPSLAEMLVEDDVPVFGVPVDDVLDTEERINAVSNGLDYMRYAYADRGLVYPFIASPTGDSLNVIDKRVAESVARLSKLSRVGGRSAKEFEKRGLCALHSFLGGWGVGVGAPRENGKGAEAAIRTFRKRLKKYECGAKWPDVFAANGDHGSDGFLILGRAWLGPVVYYQAKNSGFNLKDHPEEFARLPRVFEDWFGCRLTDTRTIIPVLGINEVLTAERKALIAADRGDAKVHLLDAVDILCSELLAKNHRLRARRLKIL